MKSLHRYEELENSNFNKSLNLQMNSTGSSSKNEISAFIDTENRYSVADKLSQVNTLIQMENIASYSFVSDCIEKGEAQVHAFWYDISSGEILFFSKNQKVRAYFNALKNTGLQNSRIFTEFYKCVYYYEIDISGAQIGQLIKPQLVFKIS